MKTKELEEAWNRLLGASEATFHACQEGFPRYRAMVMHEVKPERRYADGGIRYTCEAMIRGEDFCVCESEEEALIEELHRRCDLLAAALPCRIGDEVLLGLELLVRPHKERSVGGIACMQTTLRLTLRRSGRMRGIVPFFGKERLGEREIHAPEGIFLPRFEDEGSMTLSHYYDESGSVGSLCSEEAVLRFSFDRIPGAAVQDMLLALTESKARGKDAVVLVYLIDADKELFGNYPCMRIRMSVRIDRMANDGIGTVFGGELIACGERTKGRLLIDDYGFASFTAQG